MTAELDQSAATGAPASSWKPYPAYKDSGVEWLGKVPEHWEVWKIKHSTYVKGRIGWKGLTSNDFLDEGAYLVTGTDFADGKVNWGTCYHVSYERFDEDPYIQLKEKDILITKDGTIGKIAIAEYLPDKATLNSGIFLIRPITTNYLNDFMYWILNSEVFSTFIEYTKTGSTIQHLYQNVFENFSFPVPLIPEQRAISLYLDDRTQKIDSLIEKKQKMIELLKEERVAVINQAVTKGLNPDAPMKDSGIEWLGEVPEHWEVKRLKYVAEIRSSNVDKKSYDNEIKVFLCNYIDVYKNEFIDNSFLFMEATANENEIAKFVVKKGDILVTKDSETPDDIANPAYIKEDLINTICGYHLAQIRANKIELIGEYLFRLFQSKKFNSHFEVSANGVTRFGLSIDSFKNVFIPLPLVEEQNQIVRYIETSIKKIYQTITKIEKELLLLQEYRIALISEVVTGKIDVREAI